MTKEIMLTGLSINNGYNRQQIKALGQDQTKKGWYSRIIGTVYPRSDIDEFLKYKDFHFNNHPIKKANILLKKNNLNIKKMENKELLLQQIDDILTPFKKEDFDYDNMWLELVTLNKWGLVTYSLVHCHVCTEVEMRLTFRPETGFDLKGIESFESVAGKIHFNEEFKLDYEIVTD